MRVAARFPVIMVLLWIGIYSTAWAMEVPRIILGPQLHFDSQNQREKVWNVSAVYEVREGFIPEILLTVDKVTTHVAGMKIASRNQHDFIKYSFAIKQSDQRQEAMYGTGEEKYTFVVPAIGESTNILYHSCNGYQTDEHQKIVHGIEPMWYQILQQHQRKPFHLQLGGGDQLYADGLSWTPKTNPMLPGVGKIFGVFAIPILQPYLKALRKGLYPTVQDDLSFRVAEYYDAAYQSHYSKLYFKNAQAQIPLLAQADDHDHYDGFGSYPVHVSSQDFLKVINFEAQWYVNVWQHARTENEFLHPTATSTMLPYNFLQLVNDGKVAILGMDTRSERTPLRVVSDEKWDEIFSELENLDDTCKHLIVMLGVPVVYPESKKLDATFNFLGSTLIGKKALKAFGQINAFNEIEIKDDLRDGWGHPAHHMERDKIVERLQNFAVKKNIRVSIASGDVHLGGIGKIYQDKGLDLKQRVHPKVPTANTIYQLISSPVGNIPVAATTALVIGINGAHAQKLTNDSHMRLIRLRKGSVEEPAMKASKYSGAKNLKSKHYLISRRNYARFELGNHDVLGFTLSTEPEKSRTEFEHGHEQYHLRIPPVLVR